MTDWRNDLPPDLLAELDALNARAADVRADQAALLVRITADAREAEASGENAEALHVLMHELGAVLGDNAEIISALETRIHALEAWAARIGDIVEVEDAQGY